MDRSLGSYSFLGRFEKDTHLCPQQGRYRDYSYRCVATVTIRVEDDLAVDQAQEGLAVRQAVLPVVV